MAIADLVAGLRQACSGLSWIWIAAFILTTFLVRDVVAWYRLRHIPGPFLNSISMIPLLRHVVRGDSQAYMDDLAAKYGPIVRIAPGEVMFTDADVFRRVGSVRGGYTKSGWYDCTQFQPGPKNLIGLKDDETRRARKAQVSPGYYGKGLESFEVGVDKQLAAFIDLIESKYVSDDKTFRPMDFGLRASFFTLDVISQVAYSHPFGFMENDRDMHDFNRIVQDLFPAMSFMSMMPRLAGAAHYWPLSKMLPSPADKTGFGPMLKAINLYVEERLAGQSKSSDILQSFIDVKLDRNVLMSEVVLQILAGSDTTASAIRMILLHLISTPQAYRRLQAEIDAAVAARVITPASSPSPAIVTDAATKNMPYLQAVVREGLRIWPPAIGLAYKIVPKGGDTVTVTAFPDGKRTENGEGGERKPIFLPAGTQMGQNIVGIGRLKSLWGDDAGTFRPERWLDPDLSPERAREMQGVVDMVFGHGKFQCLGKGMAIMELHKVFVELMKRYDFAIVNPSKPIKIQSAAVWVANDFILKVTRRDAQ